MHSRVKGRYHAGMKTKHAIEHWGNRKRVAEALGLTRQAVYAWGEIVPLEAALALEVRSEGQLKVNPKLYPLWASALKEMKG